MKKLYVGFLIIVCGFAARGGLVWETGQYTPATWTAKTSGDGNILAGCIADPSAIVYYTEAGKPLTQDAAALTDGVVPGASIDYTKVFGIRSGSVTWTFESAMTLDSIRIFTRWGDGGRDGIAISKVEVLRSGDAGYSDTGAPAISYGVGNNASGGALYAFLADSGGGSVAPSVTALKLTFGTQDNSGTGYVEFEAMGREEGEYLMVAGSPGEFGAPAPCYGKTNTVYGTNYIFNCPAAYTNAAETIAAECRGWRLTLTNGTDTTGTELTKTITYTADTAHATLTWLWDVNYKVTATASAGGQVEPAEQWVPHGSNATVIASSTTPGMVFLKWSGDASGSSATLTIPSVTAPKSVTATFVSNSGHQHLYEYLQSDGTQVIDLGVQPTAQTIVEMKIRQPEKLTTKKFFGAHDGSSAGVLLGSSGNWFIGWGWNNTYTPSSDASTDYIWRIQVQTAYLPNGGYQMPSHAKNARTGTVNATAYAQNYYLFGANKAGALEARTSLRLYYLQIRRHDGFLLHDFRPAMNDDVYGLYDRVTGAFRTSFTADSNDFTVGPETGTAADALEIAADPAALPFDFVPALGVTNGLASNDTFTVSAPPLPVNTAALTATCTGWTLYSWDAVNGAWFEDPNRANHSGASASFDYVHTGVASKLVWHYTFTDPGAPRAGATRYVWNCFGDNTNAGTGWNVPYYTIQRAIDVSTDGDTIIVGPGSYTYSGIVNVTNAVTVISACGREATILDGESIFRALNITKAGATVEEFTLVNGLGSMGSDGGGASVSAGTLRCCTIKNCKSGGNARGGGVAVSGSGRVSRCIICSNYNNTAWGGVGVVMTGSSVLEHSLVFDNMHDAGGPGGGVFMQSNNPLVRNCTIYGNKATTGGGIQLGVTAASVIDSIVWGNEVTGDASEGAPNWAGSGKVTNVFSEVQWGVAVGGKVLYGNPYFRNAPARDFRLGGASACRDAAWGPATVGNDVFGNTRVQNGVMDLGAIESDPTEKSVSMTFTCDGSLDSSTVTFAAAGTGINVADAACYWTFDGRTPTDADHDAEGVSVTHVYGNGTHSAALAVVYQGGTYLDTQTGFLTVAPSILYVRPENEHAEAPYNSWAKAATDVNAAVAYAADVGSTIYVTDGVFTVSSPIFIQKQLVLRSVNGPAVTTLSGGNAHVVVNQQIGNSRLEGFTITEGKSGGVNGGGVILSDGLVTNCVICANKGTGQGRGGGLSLSGGVVSGCIISNNTIDVTWGGAGVYMSGGTLENSLVVTNHHATFGTCPGGGIQFYHHGLIRNCTIAGNVGSDGGGLNWQSSYTAQGMCDCIIRGNITTGTNPDLSGTPSTKVTNVCSSVAIGVNTTGRDLTQDPGFKAPRKGNYRLRLSSPCRDCAWGVPPTQVDLDGNPRLFGKRMDLGCYELNARSAMIFLVR